MTSKCDYILSTNPAEFQAWKIKLPCFDTDHHLVKGDLILDKPVEHRKYMMIRKTFPVKIEYSSMNNMDRALDKLAFHASQKPKETKAPCDNSWISQETWTAIDAKAEARRWNMSEKMKSLSCMIKRLLKRDWQNWVAKTT